MHRSGIEYERVDKLARDILIDYGIKEFPLDLFELCKKMGFNVIPYSAYEDDVKMLATFLKKSKDGFFLPACCNNPPTIIYNDKYGDHLTPARIQSTVGHEIKHIVEDDTNDNEDDLCDHFARYLRCPTPIVIYLGLSNEVELISRFQISGSQARHALSGIKNRCRIYGDTLFESEKELVNLFLSENIE